MFYCLFKSNSAKILVVGGRKENTKVEYYDKTVKRWQEVADFDNINRDMEWEWKSNENDTKKIQRWESDKTQTLTKSWKRTSIGYAPLVYIHDKFYTFGGEETLSRNMKGLGMYNTTTVIGCLDLNYNSNNTIVGKWSIVGFFLSLFCSKIINNF